MPFWSRRGLSKADQNVAQDSTAAAATAAAAAAAAATATATAVAAASSSGDNPQLSKEDRHMSSLVGEQKDQKEEQACDSTEGGGQSKHFVVVSAPAHGASPTTMEARPSLFRRTISSFSTKILPKMRSDSSKASGNQANANGDGRMAKTSSGGKHANEGPASAETDHVHKRGFHGLRQRFHTTHHNSGGQTTSGQYGTDHTLHLPLHLRHLHFPHILHHPAPQGATSSGDQEIEVMQVLQRATDQAKRIVERARGEHDILMQRARDEAEDEIKALRCELEQEALKNEQAGNNGEDAIREATAEEEDRIRHIFEHAAENMEASVTLCVEHVLNVDVSLAADRRGTLRNLRRNPPSFLRKSNAKSFPSERRMLAERMAKGKRNMHASDFSWDVDALEYPLVDNTSAEQEEVYATILGDRTLKEEEEVYIDFDELERPPPLGRFSSAMQSIQTTCGCLLG